MVITFRQGGESDVPRISEIFAESFDDLYRRHGLLQTPTNPIPPFPIFAFLARRAPRAFWVAEDGRKVVGFTNSFVRGSLWFLSQLFVAPGFQGRDIGRGLLERTLGSWKGVKVTNRATITFGVNPVSQSLYMRYGMYPREPTYFVEGLAKPILEDASKPEGPAYEELSSLRNSSPSLKKFDTLVLGFSHGWSHEFFFESKERCFEFKAKGTQVGYGYVHPKGRVGPVAVSSSRYMGPVLETLLKLSAAQGVEKVSYWAPGSNTQAVDLALKYRMLFDPALFMSTRPFARWPSYIFSGGALM